MKTDEDVSGEIHLIICENVLNRAYGVFKFEDTFKKIAILNKKPDNEEELFEIYNLISKSELN